MAQHSDKDRQQRLYVAAQGEKLRQGRISRREFVRRCAIAGFGFSSFGLLQACGYTNAPTTGAAPTAAQIAATAGPDTASVAQANNDTTKFLKDIGGKFKGTTLKIVSESTPPSRVIYEISKQEFTPLTGINVEWEQLPLDQVLSKVSQDTAGQLGSNDIYYFDQAWVGRFVNDVLSPTELLQKKDLAYPNFNFDDFLKPLVDHICSFNGQIIGLPYDIPIFIMMYRKDIFDKMKLTVPTTMQEYMDVVKAIDGEMKGQGVNGTVGQWKSGHYALQCDMTAWLWSHGGSHYTKDGKPSINDEKGLAGLNYMMELGKYMPSGATTWDWSGQSDAFSQGKGGVMITWSEDFPGFDVPDKSKVAGQVMAAPLPKELELRKPEDCGFGETPGIGHQGGSSICLSKYSKNQDAAWVFLQWATSPDLQIRASLLGGGDGMRQSTYDDPRVKAKSVAGPGTTRHFDVTLETIKTRMGTEPNQVPQWADLSVNVTAIELGKMTTGQQDVKTTADNMAKGLAVAAKAAKESGLI